MGNKRIIRTRGANSQWQFDKMLEDTDVSGLAYLKQKYKDDMVDYSLTHDLNNPSFFSEYKEIQQRYKMINEELENRYSFLENSDLFSKDIHFNENYDVVYKDERGEIKVYRPLMSESDGSIEIIEIEEDAIRDE